MFEPKPEFRTWKLPTGERGATTYFMEKRIEMAKFNPYSDGLMADYEEITAVAMLLGEEHPIICSCCMGKGRSTGIFGGLMSCGQCKNTGYDWLGPKTHRHFVGKHRSRT